MSSSLVNVSAAICKASSSPEVNLSFNILDKKIPGKSKTLLKIKLNSGIFSKAILTLRTVSRSSGPKLGRSF